MIRLPTIWTIARAEIRSVRRLVRYWIFSSLSAFSVVAIYMYYGVIHGLFSRFSATAGAINPRYLIGVMGLYFMLIFLLGLIFLAFDVRARDERERMAEVIDSRPLSNVELLVGRGLGLVLMALAPVLFVAMAMQTFGLTAVALDWYVGEPVEPYSLVGFVLDCVTVFSVWCSVIMLLAVLVHNRLIVAVAGLSLLGLNYWLFVTAPIYLQPVFNLSAVSLGSDLTPSLFDVSLLQRAALWVIAGACITLAAAWHPRPDRGSRARQVALGGGLIVVAGLMIGMVARQAVNDLSRRGSWLAAHEAHRDHPRTDLQAISGSVRIDPGHQVVLDIELRVQMPPDVRSDTLLFTFNPGFSVEQVATDGTESTWTHDSGLLEIAPSSLPPPGGDTVVTLVASGHPDMTFGYLDAAIDPLRVTFMDAQIMMLGVYPGVFSSRYVALMPGQGWLPHSGSDVPTGDPRTHPADYFEVDLAVDVPIDWLVAGPGRRQTLDPTGEAARFRFRPEAPVPYVGLLASRFERRAFEVAGIELEILVDPKHDRNLHFFADAADEIRARVAELFTDAADLGLPYPYGGLTLVESPWLLRGFGGGWRMDTTQTLPGVLLVRENSFTTSRFEFGFRETESFAELEGGLPRAKLEAAERYLENDFSGGNPFVGGSRNFLSFQTGATGPGAIAIDFVLDVIVTELLTGRRGYFSPFHFGRESGLVIGETITSLVTGDSDSVVDAVLAAASDRPSVWDRALGTSLADLEPTDDPARALDVLALKGHAVARSILDGLGREKTAALLAELRSRYRGRQFEAADLTSVAKEIGADLEPLLGDWLHEATLPGFVTSRVVVQRLTDDAQGLPRYQTLVHARNAEATPGLFRLRYATGDAAADTLLWEQTEPVRLAANTSVELGFVSATPPRELWLQPYLSLNRNDVRLTLPRVDQTEQVRADPLLGSRVSVWQPSEAGAIVVDDLDEGFSVEADALPDGWRIGGGGAWSSVFLGEPDMDQGLPEFRPFLGVVREWSRWERSSSWGTYRHTVAMVGAGEGDRRAVFTAELPQAGRWRLAYHAPELTGQPTRQQNDTSGGVQINIGAQISNALTGSPGTYDLTLEAGGEEHSLEFDAGAAETGWNHLGEFSLSEGPVRVVVSNQTSGQLVIADAIRWEPVSFEGN